MLSSYRLLQNSANEKRKTRVETLISASTLVFINYPFCFWMENEKVMPFSTAKQASAWGFAPQLLSPPTPRWKAAQRPAE